MPDLTIETGSGRAARLRAPPDRGALKYRPSLAAGSGNPPVQLNDHRTTGVQATLGCATEKAAARRAQAMARNWTGSRGLCQGHGDADPDGRHQGAAV